MAAKKSTDVMIAGKVYTLSGYEEEGYLQRVATYINAKISEITEREEFRRIPNDMKAILIQLNIADDFFKARTQYEDVEENYKKAEKDLFDLKHALVDTQMKVEELLGKLEAERKEHSQKGETEQLLESNYRQLEEKYKLLTDKANMSEEKNRQFEEMLRLSEQERRQLETDQKDFAARSKEFDTKKQELQAKTEELQTQNQQLQAKTNELQTQNQELQQEVVKLQTQNEQLQAKIDELQTQSKELHDQNKELQTQNKELQVQTQEQKDSCKKLKSANRELQINKEKLEAALADALLGAAKHNALNDGPVSAELSEEEITELLAPPQSDENESNSIDMDGEDDPELLELAKQIAELERQEREEKAAKHEDKESNGNS